MNWTQFKDPVCHMCLTGAMVVSWSLTQEVVGASLLLTIDNGAIKLVNKGSK